MAGKKTAKEQIVEHLSKQFYAETWKFRGSQFLHVACSGVGDVTACVHFSCGLWWVKAKVFSEGSYGIPDSVKMFMGGHAAEECIEWTANRLMELYKTVSERVAPYRQNYEQYQKALRGR